MVGALIVSGLAGIVLSFPEYVPQFLDPFADHALEAIVTSLCAAFIAASLASMMAATYFERAWRAGRGHGRTLFAAAIYMIACIGIEVAIGKIGVQFLQLDGVSDIVIVAVCTFFAFAPRLLAFVRSGIAAIDGQEQASKEAVEHERDLERVRAVTEAAEARIEAGKQAVEQERTPVRLRPVAGVAGALAAAAALSGAHEAEAVTRYPVHDVARPAPAANDARTSVRDALFGLSVTKGNEEACGRFLALMDVDPSTSNRRMERILRAEGHKTHRTTIGAWKRKLKEAGVLVYPGNGDLLDAA